MKWHITLTFLLVAALLAACGAQPTPSEPTPDIAAVRTSAASTVVAQFTLTAAVFTPTPPIAPTQSVIETEAPAETEESATQPAETSETDAALCDLLGYDAETIDISVPDNTIMMPGQEFIKIWKVKNVGTCAWGAGYALAFAGTGVKMDGQFISFTEVVQPGQEVEVSVQFKAPSQAGNYVSTWIMQNPRGFTFPEAIYVKITVQ